MRRILRTLAALALLTAPAAPALAQQQQTPPPPPPPAVKVGDVAPDFAVPAATRYGTLAEPVRLSDFRGSTVVVAFYPRARSKG